MSQDSMSPARIKALRQKRDETQEEFARFLGVSFSTVNRWEKGHAKPLPHFHRILTELYTRTQVTP